MTATRGSVRFSESRVADGVRNRIAYSKVPLSESRLQEGCQFNLLSLAWIAGETLICLVELTE